MLWLTRLAVTAGQVGQPEAVADISIAQCSQTMKGEIA